jgi:type 1 glutamine amidotransferase
VTCLAFIVLGACNAAAVNEPSAPARAIPRVLYLTHSAGFTHDVLPLSEQILRDVGMRTGAFDVTATKDCALISPEALRGWDAVVFYTTGELPMNDNQKRALVDFVRGGKGFVGIHSATDTFYNWSEYGEMLGGYFDGHPWHQSVRVRVEDQQHPSTSHLQQGFTITDEIYQFRNWSRDRVHVLLSLDPASVDLTKDGVKRTDRDFALAWTRDFGAGRVFYTALGHEADVWRDARFQQHLLGGIQWALRQR